MGLVKSRQFAKRADYWERGPFNVIYSEKFYIVKGDRNQRRLTQNKFKKIKSDFISEIEKMQEFKEENAQSQFNDICELEVKLERLVDSYIEAYGALIEEDIEQDPESIRCLKKAKNMLERGV